jgi:hypothetical protein
MGCVIGRRGAPVQPGTAGLDRRTSGAAARLPGWQRPGPRGRRRRRGDDLDRGRRRARHDLVEPPARPDDRSVRGVGVGVGRGEAQVDEQLVAPRRVAQRGEQPGERSAAGASGCGTGPAPARPSPSR